MQSLSDILGRARGKLSFGKLVDLHRVRKMWPTIVGEKLARCTFPYALKNGKLYLNAEASSWVAELEFIRFEVLGRVNMIVTDEVNDLICRVATLPIASDEERLELLKQLQHSEVVPPPIQKIDTSKLAAAIDHLPEALRETVRRITSKLSK